MPAWKNARDPAMQVWPAAAKMPASTPASTWSISASSNTMFALLPPSSSEIGFRCDPALAAIALPALSLPVKGIFPPPGVIARAFAGEPAAGDDIDDAARKARLLGEFCQFDGRCGGDF